MYIEITEFTFPEGREGDDECQIRGKDVQLRHGALREVAIGESIKLEIGGGADEMKIEISRQEFHRILAAMVDAGAETLERFNLAG